MRDAPGPTRRSARDAKLRIARRSKRLLTTDYVRDGDVLVVSRLDRIARSVLDLAKIADRLKRKNVSRLLVDSRSPAG